MFRIQRFITGRKACVEALNYPVFSGLDNGNSLTVARATRDGQSTAAIYCTFAVQSVSTQRPDDCAAWCLKISLLNLAGRK